ncbi:sensor domain-containing diguanylate cyclase [Pseudomonas petrae]|uniref:sensor domain-containing diguanylate cyclase n=1 Tax=Pseudomonas petrae TaxID=2912190 RepID=UPI003B00151A
MPLTAMPPSARGIRSGSEKMLMLGSALAVAAILAIVTSLLFRELGTANEAAVRSANNVVQLIDADVQRNAELYDTSLQGLMAAWRRPDVMTISPELRRLVLFDRATAAPYKGDLVLLDDTGRIVADSTSLTPRQDNFSDRPSFQKHRDDSSLALRVDGPFLSRWGFKDLCISFSRRLSSDNGAFVGVASASMRLSYFNQLFRTLDIGPTSTINLVNADGVLLARQPDDNNRTFIGQNFSMRPNFKRILREVNGSFAAASDLDGAQRVYTFSRVGDLPLIVVVAQSRDDVYAVWKRNALLVAGATGLLCAGILWLSWLLGRQLRLRQHAERELSGLAATDELTGLANRRRLDEVLKQEWARGIRSGRPLALLMVDVDHFKAFNDRHGHHGGDVALRSVAETLAASIRRPGDLAARYGGEEFTVVLPETDKAGACVIAEKLRLAIEALPQFADDTMPITVSIGVATHLPTTDDLPEPLFYAADRALYRAKKNGRNRVEVEPYVAPSPELQT